MIFLKKFEALGFKSFAKSIKIDFKSSLTGVVGPNGSGKTNLVDALKWVIGEQSIKQLRGSEKSDLLFMGSNSVAPAKIATVSLTFQNNGFFDEIDSDEVVITKTLDITKNEISYKLNDRDARLKDIQSMFYGTGLTKGNLCIISNHTISWFAEAKPLDRKKVFEEAAGINKYLKKKQESINMLIDVNNNLTAVSTEVDILNKQINKIKKQADDVKRYQELNSILKEINYDYLVGNVQKYATFANQYNQQLTDTNNKIKILSSDLSSLKNELNLLDVQINEIDKLAYESNEIVSNLKKQQYEYEQSQLLYKASIEKQLYSIDKTKQAQAYKEILNETKDQISKYETNIPIWEDDLSKLNNEINHLNDSYNKKFQEIQNFETKLTSLNSSFEKLSNSKPKPVNAILDIADSINGLYGVLSDNIAYDKKISNAINILLNKSLNYLVVKDEKIAQKCIDYLKQNELGIATFLPVNILKPKHILSETLSILKEFPGCLGIASSLVKAINPDLKNVVEYLLGTSIIVESDFNAHAIAKSLDYKYKVISLDGTLIAPGGIISGGSNKLNSTNPVQIKTEIEILEKNIEALKNEINTILINKQKKQSELLPLQASIESGKIQLASLEQKFNRYKEQADQLNISLDSNNIKKPESLDPNILKLIQENEIKYESAIKQKTNLVAKKQLLNQQDQIVSKELDTLRENIFGIQSEMLNSQNQLKKWQEELAKDFNLSVESALKLEVISDSKLKDLSYQVNNIKQEITKIGPINELAIQELDSIQEQFDELNSEMIKLQESSNEINESIKKLDSQARKDLKQVIKDVNNLMPEIFKYLFGGGNCELRLVDSEDILDAGIEILVNPPGKQILNLNLLSSGEKTLVALTVLFAILKVCKFPLVIFDEAEAALDPTNVERFANLLKQYAENTQFIAITHRAGTMRACETLIGATMQSRGVTNLFVANLVEIMDKNKNIIKE